MNMSRLLASGPELACPHRNIKTARARHRMAFTAKTVNETLRRMDVFRKRSIILEPLGQYPARRRSTGNQVIFDNVHHARWSAHNEQPLLDLIW